MQNKKSRFKVPVYIKWIAWVLVVQFVLINISASLYAYRLTHVNNDLALRDEKPSKNIFVKTWKLFSGPRQPRSLITEHPLFAVDTIQLKTKKGRVIDAWYSAADSSAKGTIILFHGLGSNKGMMINEASDFRFQGYNVLLVDFRAHGKSEGSTTTIGVRESEEVKLAFDYIKNKNRQPIFLWGVSMGAVVITKAMYDYQLKPSGVILEMPFGSLQNHLQGRARALGFQGFPEKPFGFFVSFWMGIERGFNGLNHSTKKYAETVDCPVLMQWGALDHYVLKEETDKIFEAIRTPDKKLVIYYKAGHESLLANDPAKWRKETESFLLANSK